MNRAQRRKNRIKQRRRHLQSQLLFENLEDRRVLAGAVYVSGSGDQLSITGDNQNNCFTVDLQANTLLDAIAGNDGTTINFSSRASTFDMNRISDLSISTKGGNDTIVVNVGSNRIHDDFRAELGRGNDVLVLQGSQANGSELGDDARIIAMDGNDLILVDEFDIGDDLRIDLDNGNDMVAFGQSSVRDRSWIHGDKGNDTTMIGGSTMSDDVKISAGRGEDIVSLSSTRFGDRLRVHGQSGTDTLSTGGISIQESRLRLSSLENSQATPSDVQPARVQVIVDWFTDASGMFDQATSEMVQETVNSLVATFGAGEVDLILDPQSQTVTTNDPSPTVSVRWDAAAQQAVAATSPGPTIAARAYAMMHTAIFDAWSAYDESAVSTQLGDSLQRPTVENTDPNKSEAMSFAAYRVLDDIFTDQTSIFDELMTDLGYDPSDLTDDTSTPAGIGNRMAQALLEFRHDDGANQLGDDPAGNGAAYSDTTGYAPDNPVGDPEVLDAWTPERLPIDAEPGVDEEIQSFLTPHWGRVAPFALTSADEFRPEPPEPFLLVEDASYDLVAQTVTLADGSTVPIEESLIGTVINPAFIAQAEEVVDFSASLTDQDKLIAEFWEDGSGTSFPPGTFMTFTQFVSARDNHTIDQDAHLFFAVSNAVFDAGIATWEAKVFYDYARPVRVIRELGELGLIGEPNETLGGNAIESWAPSSGETETILATDFLTYQTPGADPSPPFSEYTSGHSAFSTAGATILSLFTGSDEFGASVTFPAGASRFEPGVTPAEPVTLHWETFTDAANEAGLSRLYGGIHFSDGDINGRLLGEDVARKVWDRVEQHVSGAISSS